MDCQSKKKIDGECPLVSVLIPTYNRPNFFKLALESVLAQSYPNIEIIICDNSTNEETANLIEESVQQAKEDQRLAMQQQAEDYLQTQCRAVCEEVLVKVKATLSEDQVFTIEQVEIFHGEAQKGRLMQTLTQNGISEERILFH